MSMITIFRTNNPIEEQILVTVQAGTDPKRLSFRLEKSALLSQILLSVKRNMKAFEHVYYPDIYFCDPITGDIVGMDTPLAPYHGKILIAKARAGLCEGELPDTKFVLHAKVL